MSRSKMHCYMAFLVSEGFITIDDMDVFRDGLKEYVKDCMEWE